MRLIYEDGVREEGLAAAEWYEQEGEELRNRFLKAWKAAANRALANPQMHRCFRGDLRKCRFEVFPYVLIFRILEDEIQVVAIAHMSRKPGYWENRE
jgi:toxin ParE1/3/4